MYFGETSHVRNFVESTWGIHEAYLLKDMYRTTYLTIVPNHYEMNSVAQCFLSFNVRLTTKFTLITFSVAEKAWRPDQRQSDFTFSNEEKSVTIEKRDVKQQKKHKQSLKDNNLEKDVIKWGKVDIKNEKNSQRNQKKNKNKNKKKRNSNQRMKEAATVGRLVDMTPVGFNETTIAMLDLSCFMKAAGEIIVRAPTVMHARPPKYARFVNSPLQMTVSNF